MTAIQFIGVLRRVLLRDALALMALRVILFRMNLLLLIAINEKRKVSNKIFGTDIVDQSASVEVKKLQTDLVSLLNTFIQTSGAVDLMRKALTQNVTGFTTMYQMH